MNVLIACEESQRVCSAFRQKGHNAFSCDLQPCSGGHPEWHIKGDVLKFLNPSRQKIPGDNWYGFKFRTQDGVLHCIDGNWDLIIAHPPCTYLSNAGARWLYAGGKLNKERYSLGIEGKNFFMALMNANCSKIAVENPLPSSIYALPDYTQIIQPYYFGEPWSKRTCLWLKGLDMLQPTDILAEYKPFCSSGSYSGSHDPKYKGASRKGGSSRSRSKTFYGIAQAMADQWG